MAGRAGGVQLCPSTEFKLWHGSCYTFHGYDWLSWNELREVCKSKSTKLIDVDLVIINSVEEDAYVYDEMLPKSSMKYWIGLKKSSGGKEGRHFVLCYIKLNTIFSLLCDIIIRPNKIK